MKIIKQAIYIIAAIVAFGLVKWGISALQTNKTNNNLTTYFSEETWQPFNSTEGNFKVNFPTYPTTEPSKTETLGGIKATRTQYSADSKDGDSYNVVYGFYPDILPQDYNVKNGIEGSINGMVASSKSNQLISSSFVNIGNYQGADYLIFNKDEEVYIRGRVIIVSEGNNPVRAYALMVVSKNSNPTDNYNKFINSFEIIK